MILKALFWICSISSDKYCGKQYYETPDKHIRVQILYKNNKMY